MRVQRRGEKLKKAVRQQVYEKYNGHCAYCGKEIEYKDMQVDHIVPKRQGWAWEGLESIDNYNPSCRRCNHYKRARSIERFRELLLTLHNRIRENYICKVAEDYGIITVKEWDGKFYFERTAKG
jgi:5-methylcytosine-specific restriction endonuclease McrA